MKKRLLRFGISGAACVLLAIVCSLKLYGFVELEKEIPFRHLFYENGADRKIFLSFLEVFLMAEVMFLFGQKFLWQEFNLPTEGGMFYFLTAVYFWLCVGFSLVVCLWVV